MAPLPILPAPARTFCNARILIVNGFLRLDRHMNDMLRVAISEAAVYMWRRVRRGGESLFGEEGKLEVGGGALPRRWLLSSSSFP